MRSPSVKSLSLLFFLAGAILVALGVVGAFTYNSTCPPVQNPIFDCGGPIYTLDYSSVIAGIGLALAGVFVRFLFRR